MSLIAVQVHTLDTPKRMQENLRIHLLKAGIPEYSWKAQEEGFEVWHAEGNEGETLIFWHTIEEPADHKAQREGLEACAAIFQEHYWIKLDMPGMYTNVGRPTLRVLYGLHWLS